MSAPFGLMRSDCEMSTVPFIPHYIESGAEFATARRGVFVVLIGCGLILARPTTGSGCHLAPRLSLFRHDLPMRAALLIYTSE